MYSVALLNGYTKRMDTPYQLQQHGLIGEWRDKRRRLFSEETMTRLPDTSTKVNELPETLRFLRKINNLKLREVAEQTGLSISFLSDVERGRTSPSLSTVEKLASVYDVRLGVVFSE